MLAYDYSCPTEGNVNNRLTPFLFLEPARHLAVGPAHNMTVSWRGGFARDHAARPGEFGMMIGLLVAGIVAILAGLVAIVYGFLLDLSFGNTLILAGVFGVCSGLIVLAQTAVVRELRNLGRKLSPRMAAEPRSRPAAGEDGFPPARDFGLELPSIPAAAPPWREEAPSRDRMRQESAGALAGASAVAPPPEVVEPAPAKRRNLLFSSTMRKDRERPPQPLGDELVDTDQQAFPEASDAPPPSFEEAWPRADRMRPSEAMAQRRAARAALGEGKAGAAPPDRPAPRDESPPAAVIKSGVVDNMAYSLYSDGSIEAQMPEGMMRFASIDELRAHLNQRS
jgi:hypothetical protein